MKTHISFSSSLGMSSEESTSAGTVFPATSTEDTQSKSKRKRKNPRSGAVGYDLGILH